MTEQAIKEAVADTTNNISFKEVDYLTSPEVSAGGCLRREAVDVFKYFIGKDLVAKTSYAMDFMGGITSESVSEVVTPYCNSIQKFPIPGNWHGDTLEWMGTLKSVLNANQRNQHYRMAELGAGWAPWCAIAGRAF